MRNLNDRHRPVLSPSRRPGPAGGRPLARGGRPRPCRAARLAERLRRAHPETREKALAIARHPRSLARPRASWRPPALALPAVDGAGQLTLALSRRRVAAAARARLADTGREPAFLLELRFLRAGGARRLGELAEAWVRALVPAGKADAVHELSDDSDRVFCLLVDADYRPVRSPAELFERYPQRA